MTESSWCPCLPGDGDIEQNPGPRGAHIASPSRPLPGWLCLTHGSWRRALGYLVLSCLPPFLQGSSFLPDLCHLGTVERNPGPDGLFGRESFALLPSVLWTQLRRLGLRAAVDAFAAAGNALLPRWWSAETDAFRQVWRPQTLHWANPPFSLLPRLAVHLGGVPTLALVLVPDWNVPGVAAIMARACKVVRLPGGPLFCRVVWWASAARAPVGCVLVPVLAVRLALPWVLVAGPLCRRRRGGQPWAPGGLLFGVRRVVCG